MRKSLFRMSLAITVIGSGFGCKEPSTSRQASQAPRQTIKVWNEKFEVISLIRSREELEAFWQAWEARTQVSLPSDPHFTFKIDIPTGKDAGRWLLDPAGYVQILSMRKTPTYSLPINSDLSRILGLQSRQKIGVGRVQRDFLHFRLHLPSEYSLVDVSPPITDFHLFEVQHRNAVTIARLYVGNHPSLHFDANKHSRREIAAGIFLIQQKSGAPNGDLLLEFPHLEYKGEDGSPWSIIHVYDISPLANERQVVAEAMAQIEIAKKHID